MGEITLQGTSHGAQGPPQAEDLASRETAEALQRVLAVLERERHHGGLDLALVIVLGLTVLASTWCAYQAQLWNGAQLAQLIDAELAAQEAHALTLAGMSRRSLDALVFLNFMQARQ